MTPYELLRGDYYFGDAATPHLAERQMVQARRADGGNWKSWKRSTTWAARKAWLASGRRAEVDDLRRKYEIHFRRICRRLGRSSGAASVAAAYAAYHSGHDHGPSVAVMAADIMRALWQGHLMTNRVDD